MTVEQLILEATQKQVISEAAADSLRAMWRLQNADHPQPAAVVQQSTAKHEAPASTWKPTLKGK